MAIKKRFTKNILARIHAYMCLYKREAIQWESMSLLLSHQIQMLFLLNFQSNRFIFANGFLYFAFPRMLSQTDLMLKFDLTQQSVSFCYDEKKTCETNIHIKDQKTKHSGTDPLLGCLLLSLASSFKIQLYFWQHQHSYDHNQFGQQMERVVSVSQFVKRNFKVCQNISVHCVVYLHNQCILLGLIISTRP